MANRNPIIVLGSATRRKSPTIQFVLSAIVLLGWCQSSAHAQNNSAYMGLIRRPADPGRGDLEFFATVEGRYNDDQALPPRGGDYHDYWGAGADFVSGGESLTITTPKTTSEILATHQIDALPPMNKRVSAFNLNTTAGSFHKVEMFPTGNPRELLSVGTFARTMGDGRSSHGSLKFEVSIDPDLPPGPPPRLMLHSTIRLQIVEKGDQGVHVMYIKKTIGETEIEAHYNRQFGDQWRVLKRQVIDGQVVMTEKLSPGRNLKTTLIATQPVAPGDTILASDQCSYLIGVQTESGQAKRKIGMVSVLDHGSAVLKNHRE